MGFFSDLLGKSSAKEAQALGARNAKQLNDSYDAANRDATTGYDTSMAFLSPYAQTGGNAFNLLASSYGANGNEARTSAFNTFQSDPFNQHSDELTSNALYNLMKRYNAQGMGNSGTSRLALSRAGLEANDRRIADWRNGLSGLGNTGYSAAGNQAGLTTGYYDNMANRRIGLGTSLVQNDTNATMAANNARMQGANNVLSTIGSVAGLGLRGYFGMK